MRGMKPAQPESLAAIISRRSVLAGAGAVSAIFAFGSGHAFAASALTQFKPSGTASMNHSAFDAILRDYVKPDDAGYNRVDYRGMKSAHGALKAYVSGLEAAEPSGFGRAEAHAYWINLYNARTLDVVLDHYPVASIKKIALSGGGLFGSGPWSKKIMTVEGETLSLDDIEHRIVRPIFGDALSHYGLNCASYSCPNLAAKAYTGANLNAQLAAGATAYVNHPRGVSVAGGRITASKIYSWYASDFGGKGKLKAHWQSYAEPQLSALVSAAEIGGYDYDWSLNDA